MFLVEESPTVEQVEKEEKPSEVLEKNACLLCCKDADKNEKTAKACSCRSESSASSEDSVVLDKVGLTSRPCHSGHPVIHRSVLLTLCLFETAQPEVKVEEEELSELQLRLLALQSASKKWQQKEQQVMKRSKDRITKVVQEKSAGSAAAPPGRQRIATRSTSSSSSNATGASDRRTRSKPLDRDRDRAKITTRPPDRQRPKPSPKAGPKAPLERGRTPGKPHMAKKMISPGETEMDDRSRRGMKLAAVVSSCRVITRPLLLPIRLGGQAGVQEAAAENVEAAAAGRAGGKTPSGGGGAAEARGGDPANPRSVQPGRAVQPLHEAGWGQDEDAQQSKTFIFCSSVVNRFWFTTEEERTAVGTGSVWGTDVMLFIPQSTDREHRKSTGKQGVDASGNLYQYDNYDEVAMDTDSEPGSPGEESPAFTVLFC